MKTWEDWTRLWGGVAVAQRVVPLVKDEAGVFFFNLWAEVVGLGFFPRGECCPACIGVRRNRILDEFQ